MWGWGGDLGVGFGGGDRGVGISGGYDGCLVWSEWSSIERIGFVYEGKDWWYIERYSRVWFFIKYMFNYIVIGNWFRVFRV